MSETWDFYRLLVDSEPALTFVDLGFRNTAPVTPYDKMAYLRVRMLKPREDGLPSPEEFDSLNQIEGAITERISENTETVYVGSNTCGGNRDFYFYTSNAEAFQAAAAEAMAAFPTHPFVTGSRSDPEWRTYLDFLHPSPTQVQQIKNRGVMEQLQKHGDALVQPREIGHFAYFSNLADCEAFSIAISKRGFAVRLAPILPGSAEYGVEFSRVDKPTEIDAVTVELSQAALAHRGHYDGWECQVITH